MTQSVETLQKSKKKNESLLDMIVALQNQRFGGQKFKR